MNRRHRSRIERLEVTAPRRRWDFDHIPSDELERLQRHLLELMTNPSTGSPFPEHVAQINAVFGSFERAMAEVNEKPDSVGAGLREFLEVGGPVIPETMAKRQRKRLRH